MAELKTKPTSESVDDFVAAIPDPSRRADCAQLVTLMKKVTGERPQMWGASMVGFGSYEYHYASGRSGTWFTVGFSPRKNDLTIYLARGFDQVGDLLARLGKHKIGKSCLYVKRLGDVDVDVLAQMLARSHNG